MEIVTQKVFPSVKMVLAVSRVNVRSKASCVGDGFGEALEFDLPHQMSLDELVNLFSWN